LINDRFTARVLGLLVVALTLIIDVSSIVFVAPETRAKPGHFALVVAPSLPLLALGIYLLVRARRLEDGDA
jgi:hypothetical protein